jgi:uncharacterized protein (UPF0332 family)
MQYALDLWGRAAETLRVARALVGYSDDNAASRAYYAAFYAVSALFAMEGKTFKKHSAVEGAVHRELVKTGRWRQELGKDFSRLVSLRERGDYGGDRHVSREEATEAVERAGRVVEQVRLEYQGLFKADASADLFQELEDHEEHDS